ncbi:sensor histidine kinase [Galbibacter pacificus]|uniref:histidine kinase n=1 Tax=Galbibacter pacificus TaxID=2996052 RepID=A0ABT6FRG5_9FLAO|nr:HAMP domain-containing sensor histidine kinase [Galbibacter pacificus]MDG3581690.1 HAMP domain-containing sensor histidine kinase [Galbibacter pacificus]MDG3585836.1 HAMP domain-containing sensor histidine kinase [Galbibacter pacificus]
MSRRLFVLLVILMSLSLMGIIFVQGYWIKTAVEDKEEQFSNTISQVLHSVSRKIQDREIRDYFDKYISLRDSIGTLKESNLKEFFFVEKDRNSNETYIYSHGILEEDYGISSTFFDNTNADSSTIKNYTSKRTTQIFKEEYGIDGKVYSPVERIEKIGGFSALEKAQFDDVFKEAANRVPIHKRVTPQEIELLMQKELKNRGVNLNFEYGVFSKGLATRVHSGNTVQLAASRYKTPLFIDSDGHSNYDLIVSFPEKKKFLISSIIEMALLSVVFTLIIIVAYSSALYQLIKQKQISEIKTDFINNMTHEFKTPIATINLALDAMKNPKAFEDKDRVKRYLQMIRDENKRMHAQVENVLRISKLEKNQLDISKDKVDVHDLIDEAIAHVELMVENRGGYIKAHLDAERSEILGNDFHLTNILVNILDNANKYSPDAPEIDVYTEVVKNSIVVKITDHGAGMSKAVLKRIFEKFYRESTGNIHNIKGHGLGLAYVKSIVEDHQGEVYAESEKDKGSTFFVKLPLI